MTLSIAIAGAGGRMGRALVRAASHDARFLVVGGTEKSDGQFLGIDLGALAGVAPLMMNTSEAANLAADKAEIWIDFTAPEASVAALEALADTPVRAAVIGTTGLSPEQEARIAQHAKRIAIVRSGNFSLGVTLLAALVEQAAQRLGPDWDIEISEAHHRRKADAPSGTALLLGEAAARGRKASLPSIRLKPHDGVTGERTIGGSTARSSPTARSRRRSGPPTSRQAFTA
jgi:4-hydroxy-tetrahydrodipicolinate reductase